MNDWLSGPRPEKWWTGKNPADRTTPGLSETGVMHSLPQLQFKDVTRQDVLNYFDNTWTLTETLFSGLQGEEAFIRPPSHQLRHPLIFYYGHPAILYVNKLRVAGLLEKSLNPYFEKIFETGVDEMSWDDMSKNKMTWPKVSDVHEYRRQVYQIVKNLIVNDPRLDPQAKPFSQESPAWALVMGFEHERIHLETSSVLMRELPLEFVHKPQAWPKIELGSLTQTNRTEGTIEMEQGTVQLGKPFDAPSFGWDNEYGTRTQDVPAFVFARGLVANQDYLQFVAAGGYREPRYWSEEGWRWRSFRNTKAPPFWIPEGPAGLHRYAIRTIFEVVPFQPAWPAIVNYHEAKAYCAWLTEQEKAETPYRLISEAEHHRLRTFVSNDATWNLDLRHGGEVEVSRYASNGISDAFGNVWQWCEDDFNPLEGFRPHAYYEDFSTPCFDARHQMIMGGSFASTGDEAGPYARFQFRRHFFQHAGLRLVRSLSPLSGPSATHLTPPSRYETEDLLSQYLLLHFADTHEVFPYRQGPTEALDFPRRCAEMLVQTVQEHGVSFGTALDIGCAVGGSSFALSERFDHVTGIDLSTSFIQAATHLKTHGSLAYRRKDQGEVSTSLTARRPTNAKPERITFAEADACHLPSNMKGFDAVLMANLLCRLPDPSGCLRAMGGPDGVVKPGGILMLVSPYSWLSDHTARERWIGGQVDSQGQTRESNAELKLILEDEFEFLSEDEMPLLIREHARKFQYIVSHLMLWRRRK